MQALKTPSLSAVGQSAQKFPFQPETQPENRPSRVLTVELISGAKYPSEAFPALTEAEELEAIKAALPLILFNAQKEKDYRIQGEIAAEKRRAAAFVPDTAELLLAEVIKRGQKMAIDRHWRTPFALTQWNKHIYEALSLYFVGDERFETEGAEILGYAPGELSLNKGILLCGPKGVGKSDMLELFARNPYAPYTVVSCLEIENEYSKKDGGPNVLDQYAGLIPTNDASKYYGHYHLGVQFDDFGAEGEAVHMGKRVNLMDMVLQTRYRVARGPYTHLTTNASDAQIQATYDGRVYDRMIQMFNLVEFDTQAPSLRV